MDEIFEGEGGHIVVDGATGYLGTHLAHKLITSGFPVRCLVHPGAKREDLEKLRKIGAEVYIGSLDANDEQSPAVHRAFAGAVAAVHLIGSVAPKKGEDLVAMHAGQTEWFIRHVTRGGVMRVVMVTTVGAAEDAETLYQRSKWQGEQVIKESGIPYTILRPTLIVGRQLGYRDSKLIKRYREMISKKPVVPVIAGGHNRVQPIYIGDLVQAIIRCIFPSKWQRNADGRELEVGGPDVVEMRQLLQMLMDVMEMRKPIIALPVPIASMVALYCENYQKVPTVSKDQVKLSLSDNVCTDNALASVLGIEPTPLEQALESYADLTARQVVTGAKN